MLTALLVGYTSVLREVEVHTCCLSVYSMYIAREAASFFLVIVVLPPPLFFCV